MRNQRGFTVGQLIGVLAVGAVLLAIAGFVVFGDNKTNLMFQGARMPAAPTAAVSVPAAGTNLRSYSFVDAFGRLCTGVYSNEGGSWGDCDFPPGWEPTEALRGLLSKS